MSDEELEAIAYLRKVRDKNLFLFCNDIRIVLNLITKQQKELETYKKMCEKLGEFVGFRTTGCPYIPKKPCHNNIDYGKSCKECIMDWAKSEVLKDE